MPEPSALPWVVYIRRSQKSEFDADLSDDQQEQAARRRIPPGAPVIVIADSGGHNSGGSILRPGYQRLLELIRTDAVAGVAAYDKSRLNRDTGANAALRDLCMEHGVALAADDSPPDHLYTAEGGLIWDTSSAADAYLRRKQSEKMRGQAVTAFEAGRHRGDDPFGYESERDGMGRIAQPRRLVVVEEEATMVRRVFVLLTHHPMSEVARILNDEGVRRRDRLWSKESVKDLWRRRRLYRGYVTRRAGRREYGDRLVLQVVADERPGTHDPILSEDEYGAAVAAVEARRRQRSAPRRVHRVYLLRGVTICATCGSRMRGDTRLSRGKAWRYMTCPVSDGKSAVLDDEGQAVPCEARRVPADAAEQHVLDAIRTMRLPDEAVAEYRAELARLVAAEDSGEVGKQRERLLARGARLTEMYEWGHVSPEDYQTKRAAIDVELAALPAENRRLESFDEMARRVRDLPDAMEQASPAALQELVSLVVGRVVTRERQVLAVEWAPAAAPFFAQPKPLSFERPRRDSNPRRPP